MASSVVTQPQPEVSLNERFFRYFQHEATALQEQMDRLADTALAGGERNDAIDHCLAGIARLSHEVKDASSYIPAYDQRTYGEAIKALSEKLQKTRSAFAPRSKFSFKTRQKNPSAISLTDAAELAAQNRLRVPGHTSDTSGANSSFITSPADAASPAEEKPEAELYANKNLTGTGQENSSAIRKPSFSNSTSVTISNHTSVHIILPSSASHATTSGTLSNLRHCIVDMSQPTSNGGPFAGLILKNIKESLIVCGQVSGPAHITGVENSVVAAACRQFRMHSSKNVDVYLHCSSRPIIEDCENIRFAPLPEVYITKEHIQTQNQWSQVDDFKWLKSEPSPHWSVLPPEQKIRDGIWKDVVPGGPGLGVDEILQAVAIAKA
ncbi:TBCC-domain-containing protein [Glonium stellatum]|uniref:TBCC-domain-containing protein n=1 Tax=Glonium stellatum TaxID=574774 RepID=A0A8E2EUA8_9PEZI|nr:TBCC-domain-containing protein [Glonium stellatum]